MGTRRISYGEKEKRTRKIEWNWIHLSPFYCHSRPLFLRIFPLSRNLLLGLFIRYWRPKSFLVNRRLQENVKARHNLFCTPSIISPPFFAPSSVAGSAAVSYLPPHIVPTASYEWQKLIVEQFWEHTAHLWCVRRNQYHKWHPPPLCLRPPIHRDNGSCRPARERRCPLPCRAEQLDFFRSGMCRCPFVPRCRTLSLSSSYRRSRLATATTFFVVIWYHLT